MNSLVKNIVLAIAILLAQTAMAVHDVDCLDEAHDQVCQVFFALDHTATNAPNQTKFLNNYRTHCLYHDDVKVSERGAVSHYCSRAPPKRS